MTDLNHDAVKCDTSRYKKILICNNFYIIRDNFQKKMVARCVELYYKRLTD